MKRTVFLFWMVLVSSILIQAQPIAATDSSFLVSLNQQIDSYVVQRNIAALDSLYATDFVFSHGTGLVEGKSSWLATVARANYPLRQHDSVTVELHTGVAIVKGKMFIQKINAGKTDRYHLRYIRVYAWRNNRWLLVSHNTTYEWHEG
jgi:Domain of unknown function (DUF4440)